jgi:hypothetical protein
MRSEYFALLSRRRQALVTVRVGEAQAVQRLLKFAHDTWEGTLTLSHDGAVSPALSNWLRKNLGETLQLEPVVRVQEEKPTALFEN